MSKVCSKCKLEKEFSEFNKKGKALSGYCKSCNKENLKKHYNENKQYYINKRRAFQQKTAKKKWDYKRSLSCTDCNISFKENPEICDFNHIEDNKEYTPGTICQSWKRYMEEIKKCIPLCANCHRIRHKYSQVV